MRTLKSWMSSIDEKTPIPPAVEKFVVVHSIQHPVGAVGREPTDKEKEPRAATSLSLPEVEKKLFGLVSAVAPAVSVASCTKISTIQANSRPAAT